MIRQRSALRRFSCLEAAGAMAAVAKRLVLRLPTAAQRHQILTGRYHKLVAQVVRNPDGTMYYQRAILAAADGDRFGHELAPWYYLMHFQKGVFV
jgi:hypothetical protein